MYVTSLLNKLMLRTIQSSQTPTATMYEIEDVSTIELLIAKYTRLSQTHEMSGNIAASMTCDILVVELSSALDAAKEYHRLVS
jgi:hypothetical protein